VLAISDEINSDARGRTVAASTPTSTEPDELVRLMAAAI